MVDIREQLGEERAKRVQAERERDELAAELEALREPRESPETASESLPASRKEWPLLGHGWETYGTSAREAEESLQRRSERSWWRRFFGLEQGSDTRYLRAPWLCRTLSVSLLL